MPANPIGAHGLLPGRYMYGKRNLLLTMKGLIILQLQILSVRTLIPGSHASYTGLTLLLLALRLDVATIWEIEAQVRFLQRSDRQG